jgi:protein phosphatase
MKRMKLDFQIAACEQNKVSEMKNDRIRMDDDLKNIFSLFLNLIKSSNLETKIPIPFLSQQSLIYIASHARNLLMNEEILLQIEGSFIIVGDLHGNLHELIIIFRQFEIPPENNFIFLGDYIDRGNFSIETVTFVFLMKIYFPNNIFLLRGNHEFEFVCSKLGFLSELQHLGCNEEVFQEFIFTFDHLPLAAQINQKILCVHAGIGPNFNSLEKLKLLSKPIHSLDNKIVNEIVWSDPCKEDVTLKPQNIGADYDFLRSS